MNDPDKVRIGLGVEVYRNLLAKRWEFLMAKFELLKNDGRIWYNKTWCFKSANVPDKNIYTHNGEVLIKLFESEELLKQQHSEDTYEQLERIKEIYKLFYLKILVKYTIRNKDGNEFHPAIILLKALKKHEYLTYWEWYLLNTFINSDNNPEEEQEFDKYIMSFRNGSLKASELKIVENVLAHSYILGNFAYAGLIKIEGKKENMKITMRKKIWLMRFFRVGEVSWVEEYYKAIDSKIDENLKDYEMRNEYTHSKPSVPKPSWENILYGVPEWQNIL